MKTSLPFDFYEYFRLLRESRKSDSDNAGSTVEMMLTLVNEVDTCIRQHNSSGALQKLDGLKRLLNAGRELFDDVAAIEDRHSCLVETTMLRKQVFELIKEIAELRGQDMIAAEAERRIRAMDNFFAAAIEDLDEDNMTCS